ncbi:unnamed protein product [marine sediment metagenome]|uniref:Uncharacterized protein n=1 Tax=marine sediment metagenome TaxID=412755 RepID=X1JAH6_9ZZZZ
MTSVQVQRAAGIGQVILAATILVVQIVGLIRGRTAGSHVGPEAS